MIALAACSFLLVTFVLERAISLRRGRVIPKPFVTRFLEQVRQGELEPAEALDSATRTAALRPRSSPAPCGNGAGRPSRSSRP